MLLYCNGKKDFCSKDVCDSSCEHHDGSGAKCVMQKTNADRIRAMSDEELADFFFESPEIEFGVCKYCENFGGYASEFPCLTEHGSCDVSDKNEAFKKWLKQPAEEE